MYTTGKHRLYFGHGVGVSVFLLSYWLDEKRETPGHRVDLPRWVRW